MPANDEVIQQPQAQGQHSGLGPGLERPHFRDHSPDCAIDRGVKSNDLLQLDHESLRATWHRSFSI